MNQSISFANPSWGDLWYFLSYAILIICFFKLYRFFYKKNEKGIVYFYFFIALCANIITVLPCYILFLMLKSYGIAKSILSLVIVTNSLPFSALVAQYWLPLFLGWQELTKKERILAFLVGLSGFIACFLGLISIHFVIPNAF